MKVLLLVPNFRWARKERHTLWHYIPYNLCLLAACLSGQAEVVIVDANKLDLSPEELRRRIRQEHPEAVGITAMTDEYGPAAHLAAELVKKEVHAPVIAGGVYASTNPEQVIADRNFDYVVIGEGERVFPQLIRYLDSAWKGIAADLPAQGICYWSDGAIVNLGRAEAIADPDILPLPDYSLIDFPAYAASAERSSVDGPPAYPYARLFTSRGCPFRCVFCQVGEIMGKKFRPRSPGNVLAEMEWLKSRYGIRSVIFDDDNMLFSRPRAEEIFRGMIERKLDLEWSMIATAVFAMDQELILLMRQSGCRYLDVAIETGSPRVMHDIVGKPVDLAKAREVIAQSRRAGIFVAANFVIGLPGETWGEIRNSLRVAEEMEADYVKIFPAVPLPHTRLWDLCESTGSFKPSFDPGNIRWSTGQTQAPDYSHHDLTVLRAYEWDRINFRSPERTSRIADRMGVALDEIERIRIETRANAIELLKK